MALKAGYHGIKKSLLDKLLQLIDAGGGGGVNFSTLEQDTGLKWVDGKKIYQKTYSLTKSEFKEVQSSSSLWSGYLYTDLDDYDSIWLDLGNSFILRNGPASSTTFQRSLCLEQGDTGGIRTTIFDGDVDRNAGKPYIFLKVQYAHGIIYPNDQNPNFYITVRYTKASEN